MAGSRLTDDVHSVNDRNAESGASTVKRMKTRSGSVALTVVGLIAVLIGGVFAGQGANLIPGSSMTGDRTWLYIGVIVAIVGIIAVVTGLRRLGRGRAD
jgi:protein-S-isoprenylcysteine O-methyltransferase Ste14